MSIDSSKIKLNKKDCRSEVPIIFFLHGLKSITWNNYEDFANWLNKQNHPKPELAAFEYYDNNNKKSLKIKSMINIIEDNFSGVIATKRPIIIVGYSLGAVLASRLITQHPNANVIKVVFVAPAFSIGPIRVLGKYINLLFKKIKLYFKMNKLQRKRYSRMRRIQKNSSSAQSIKELYLGKIIWKIFWLQRFNRKYLKKVNLKKIDIFYGEDDISISNNKNIKFIARKTKHQNTKLKIIKIAKCNHVTIITSGNVKLFKHIIAR